MYKENRKKRAVSLPSTMPTAEEIRKRAAEDPTQINGNFISVTDLRKKYEGDSLRGIGVDIEWTLISNDPVPVLKFIVVTGNEERPLLPVRVYCTTDMKATFIGKDNAAKPGIFPAWCTFPLGPTIKGKQMYKCSYIRMGEDEQKAWAKTILKLDFPCLKYTREALQVNYHTPTHPHTNPHIYTILIIQNTLANLPVFFCVRMFSGN